MSLPKALTSSIVSTRRLRRRSLATSTPLPSVPATGAAAPEHDALLTALGFDPVGLDLLQQRTGLPTALLSARLMALELEGQVARLPGGLYQRTGRA